MTVTADTVALNVSYEGLLLTVFNTDKHEKVVSSKKHSQIKARVLKPYLIRKMAEKPTLKGRTYQYRPYKGIPLPPGLDKKSTHS